MSPELPKIPFQELEEEKIPNSIVVELERDRQFSKEQIEKIIGLSELTISSDIEEGKFTEIHQVKYVTFSPNDNGKLIMCLANPKQWRHINMWDLIQGNFKENLTLRDGGYFEIAIEDGKQYIPPYLSEGLSDLTDEITPNQCFECRDKIAEMDIGIKIL